MGKKKYIKKTKYPKKKPSKPSPEPPSTAQTKRKSYNGFGTVLCKQLITTVKGLQYGHCQDGRKKNGGTKPRCPLWRLYVLEFIDATKAPRIDNVGAVNCRCGFRYERKGRISIQVRVIRTHSRVCVLTPPWAQAYIRRWDCVAKEKLIRKLTGGNSSAVGLCSLGAGKNVALGQIQNRGSNNERKGLFNSKDNIVLSIENGSGNVIINGPVTGGSGNTHGSTVGGSKPYINGRGYNSEDHMDSNHNKTISCDDDKSTIFMDLSGAGVDDNKEVEMKEVSGGADDNKEVEMKELPLPNASPSISIKFEPISHAPTKYIPTPPPIYEPSCAPTFNPTNNPFLPPSSAPTTPMIPMPTDFSSLNYIGSELGPQPPTQSWTHYYAQIRHEKRIDDCYFNSIVNHGGHFNQYATMEYLETRELLVAYVLEYGKAPPPPPPATKLRGKLMKEHLICCQGSADDCIVRAGVFTNMTDGFSKGGIKSFTHMAATIGGCAFIIDNTQYGLEGNGDDLYNIGVQVLNKYIYKGVIINGNMGDCTGSEEVYKQMMSDTMGCTKMGCMQHVSYNASGKIFKLLIWADSLMKDNREMIGKIWNSNLGILFRRMLGKADNDWIDIKPYSSNSIEWNQDINICHWLMNKQNQLRTLINCIDAKKWCNNIFRLKWNNATHWERISKFIVYLSPFKVVINSLSFDQSNAAIGLYGASWLIKSFRYDIIHRVGGSFVCDERKLKEEEDDDPDMDEKATLSFETLDMMIDIENICIAKRYIIGKKQEENRYVLVNNCYELKSDFEKICNGITGYLLMRYQKHIYNGCWDFIFFTHPQCRKLKLYQNEIHFQSGVDWFINYMDYDDLEDKEVKVRTILWNYRHFVGRFGEGSFHEDNYSEYEMGDRPLDLMYAYSGWKYIADDASEPGGVMKDIGVGVMKHHSIVGCNFKMEQAISMFNYSSAASKMHKKYITKSREWYLRWNNSQINKFKEFM